MSAYMQVELRAEDVVQAMLEDGAFAREMWREIAEKLRSGLLLHECVEHVEAGFDLREKKAFLGSLLLMADCIQTQIEDSGLPN